MRSLKARYSYARKKSPEQYSTYTCFVIAIRGQNFNQETISRNFRKLVEEDDFLEEDKNEVIRSLYKLSNNPEDKDFDIKNRLRKLKKGEDIVF